jgi:steroid delta-isomerase-like uncharacterized protein
MSEHDNKAIVRRMIEQGMIKGDFDSALRAYAPQFVYHNAVLKDMPSLPPGAEAIRILMSGARAAFPDMKYSIDSLIGEEDMVAVLYSWQGTHTGDMPGAPPTGRPVSAMGVIVCRLADGKIVEQWDIDDRLDVMQQLGLLPTLPAAPQSTRDDPTP